MKITKKMKKELYDNIKAQIDGFVETVVVKGDAPDDLYDIIEEVLGDVRLFEA